MFRSMAGTAVVGVFLATAPLFSWACATCGCTLSSDSAMGYSADAGWRLSVEYDYQHQDQLRQGTRTASGVPDGNELERETLSRYFTVDLHYSPTADWNIDLKVPYVQRTHSTYGAYDSTAPLAQLSSSRSSSVGDIKLIGSYQGILAQHNLGMQLGVKLPTGRYGTSIPFNSGPADGTPLDASLQPGSGSTDLILGAYFYQAISRSFNVIINGQFQGAVKQKLDQPGHDYRPGNAATLNVGLRYDLNPRWVPQLQLNLLHKSADRGALADIPDTAGTVAYLSPGLTARVLPKLHVFGFVQLPIYSNLDGYQLFAQFTVSVGASYGF
ncbi:MAG: transporter [Pseudomonadota bacterium]|nr:transporter [Pseudomonadota bacterium]